MNYETLVKWIRLNRKINMDNHFCYNNDCIYYKDRMDKDIPDKLKRSKLVEIEWFVDINGYIVYWICPKCGNKSTTGNMHSYLDELLNVRQSSKLTSEIRHLIFNPQGVVS